MLRQISDYLFMGSLIFLVITVMTFIGGGGISNSNLTIDNGALTDLQMNDHKHRLEKPTNNVYNKLFRLLKSYFFWIPIIGILVSIVLSKV